MCKRPLDVNTDKNLWSQLLIGTKEKRTQDTLSFFTAQCPLWRDPEELLSLQRMGMCISQRLPQSEPPRKVLYVSVSPPCEPYPCPSEAPHGQQDSISVCLQLPEEN